VAYFFCVVPEHVPTTLGVLVAVCGRRWTVEEDHEFSKDQFGFDQSQARLYIPIMRHIVLVMAALAICAITIAGSRAHVDPLPNPDQPHPTTTGQPRTHPTDRGRGQTPVPPAHPHLAAAEHYLHWSHWRRRHQARARWYHHRARPT